MKMKERFTGRLVSLILAAIMICTAGPVFAVSEETDPSFAEAGDIVCHDTEVEAAAELREHMKQRDTEVTIGIKGSTDQEGLQKIIGRLVDEAAAHTGKPDEGDYLTFQYASFKGYASADAEGDTPSVKIEYELSYYDDAGKAAETDEKVREILDSLELTDKTEYEKVKAIHDYICDNVEYEAAEAASDIRRTAYGALVEGRAVCQGYSVSLYRLLLEAGIDNRIIYGSGISPFGTTAAHTWNIVELYGKYYYLDATWDDSSNSRDYFLKPAGSGFDDEHIADDRYEDVSFAEHYQMADEEFNAEYDSLLSSVSFITKMISDGFKEEFLKDNE